MPSSLGKIRSSAAASRFFSRQLRRRGATTSGIVTGALLFRVFALPGRSLLRPQFSYLWGQFTVCVSEAELPVNSVLPL